MDLTSIESYDFAVPEAQIAQTPLVDREGSRLFACKKPDVFEHSMFRQLPDLLESGTVLVVNNTKVIEARLLLKGPQGGSRELFLLGAPEADSETSGRAVGEALARPLRKFRVGQTLDLEDGASLEVVDLIEHPDYPKIRYAFSGSPEEMLAWLSRHAYLPLPSYIKRPFPKPAAQSGELNRYNTVYAEASGSVAAPTAGLHFGSGVMTALKEAGVFIEHVTLHVGAGTFLPVRHQDVSKHLMHSEHYSVPAATLERIEAARQANKPVIAVGTTALRSLEAHAWRAEQAGVSMQDLADDWASTDLFIRPQATVHPDGKVEQTLYQPRMVDGLVTNFHQPKSTLFMLICALVGFEQAHSYYQEAISNGYRLFSYGDACYFDLRDDS